jgi:hypothetical protein
LKENEKDQPPVRGDEPMYPPQTPFNQIYSPQIYTQNINLNGNNKNIEFVAKEISLEEKIKYLEEISETAQTNYLNAVSRILDLEINNGYFLKKVETLEEKVNTMETELNKCKKAVLEFIALAQANKLNIQNNPRKY